MGSARSEACIADPKKGEALELKGFLSPLRARGTAGWCYKRPGLAFVTSLKAGRRFPYGTPKSFRPSQPQAFDGKCHRCPPASLDPTALALAAPSRNVHSQQTHVLLELPHPFVSRRRSDERGCWGLIRLSLTRWTGF
jgi:hypothetical protein